MIQVSKLKHDKKVQYLYDKGVINLYYFIEVFVFVWSRKTFSNFIYSERSKKPQGSRGKYWGTLVYKINLVQG